MTALETVADVFCVETDCPANTHCTVCPAMLCPAHSDEFTTCAANEDLLHHLDCALECIDCSAASAQDADEDRCERYAREGW